MSDHYQSGIIGTTHCHTEVECTGWNVSVLFFTGEGDDHFYQYHSLRLPPDIARQLGEHLIKAADYNDAFQAERKRQIEAA